VDVEVLRIVDVFVGTCPDGIDNSWLEIEEDGAWDITGIVRLVEEDIFAVAAFAREILKIAVLINAMFLA
jgi:hypothetical protein